MLTKTPIEELAWSAGSELGVSHLVSISQETVDAFADVTGDHLTFERAGGGRPVCVANAIYRVFE